MEARLPQLGEERHALRRTGRQRVDGEFIRRCFAVHAQAQAGVARLFLAVIAHPRLDAQRLLHCAQSTRHAQSAHAEIRLLVFVHENDVRLDLGLGAFEGALDFRKLPPARRLAVGDEIDFLSQRQPATERVECLLQRGENVRRAIRQRRFAERLAGEIQIKRRLRDDRLHEVAGEEHRRRAAGRHRIQRLLRSLTRLVEARGRAVAHAHALGIIEDDDASHFGLAEEIIRVGENRRTRQRQREQRQQQAAQGEENHVLDAHPPLVLLDGILQETHRRPDDLVELPPVQQMDDDRHRHRGQAGQHDGIEETHARCSKARKRCS